MEIDFLGAAIHRQLDHGVDLLLMAMHATGGEQAEDMHRLVVGDGCVHRFSEGLVAEERTGLDGTADAGKFLVDNAPGTQIQVTHLGVAHLAGGQAHLGTGAPDQGMGILLPETIPDGLPGLGNGVIIDFFAVTPAIEDYQ